MRLQEHAFMQLQQLAGGISLEGTRHVFTGSPAHPVHVHTAFACPLSSAFPQV